MKTQSFHFFSFPYIPAKLFSLSSDGTEVLILQGKGVRLCELHSQLTAMRSCVAVWIGSAVRLPCGVEHRGAGKQRFQIPWNGDAEAHCVCPSWF